MASHASTFPAAFAQWQDCHAERNAFDTGVHDAAMNEFEAVKQRHGGAVWQQNDPTAPEDYRKASEAADEAEATFDKLVDASRDAADHALKLPAMTLAQIADKIDMGTKENLFSALTVSDGDDQSHPIQIIRADLAAIVSRETAWTKALATFRAADIAMNTCTEFGPMWEANEAHSAIKAGAIKAHGSLAAAKLHPAASQRLAASFKDVTSAEETYGDRYAIPAHRAAAALVKVPAPDLEAVQIKRDVINRYELAMYDDGEGYSVFQIVMFDIQRLAGEA